MLANTNTLMTEQKKGGIGPESDSLPPPPTTTYLTFASIPAHYTVVQFQMSVEMMAHDFTPRSIKRSIITAVNACCSCICDPLQKVGSSCVSPGRPHPHLLAVRNRHHRVYSARFVSFHSSKPG